MRAVEAQLNYLGPTTERPDFHMEPGKTKLVLEPHAAPTLDARALDVSLSSNARRGSGQGRDGLGDDLRGHLEIPLESRVHAALGLCRSLDDRGASIQPISRLVHVQQ